MSEAQETIESDTQRASEKLRDITLTCNLWTRIKQPARALPISFGVELSKLDGRAVIQCKIQIVKNIKLPSGTRSNLI